MKINPTWKPLGIIVVIVVVLYVVVGSLNLFRASVQRSSGSVTLGMPMMGDENLTESGPADSSITDMPMIGEGIAVSEKGSSAPSPMAPDRTIMPLPPDIAPSGATQDERMMLGARIIQTGSISMRVDDAVQRLNKIRELVESANGFIADSSVTEQSGVKTANVTVRVPVDAYQDIRAKIRALGSTIFNETGHADDVTDQFVDLNARLAAAKAEEAQYLDILTRATTIEDTLRVTNQLSQVRARIEQMQGQMRYLQDRTEFATLSVHMTEETHVTVPTDEWRPGEVLRSALRDLVIVSQSVINFTITALTFIIGLLLPLGLIIWFFVWVGKRLVSKRRKNKK